MDLSLKKHDLQVQQDLPQDLSVRKPRSSASSDRLLPQQILLPSPADKPKVSSAHLEKASSLFDHRASALVPPLVDHKSILMPSLMEQKSRIIPDLDQYIRAMMDLKPVFVDQHLRSLTQSKSKSVSTQGRKPGGDVRCTSLVVPKRSALVIPDPKSRTAHEHRSKQDSKSDKLKTSIAHPSSEELQRKQLLDLRKKNHISHTITERLLSNDLHQNEYVDKDFVRSLQAHVSSHQSPASSWTFPLMSEDSVTFFQNPLLPQCSESSSPVTLMKEERRGPPKRRRKQECPKKRIKMDYRPPEDQEQEQEPDQQQEEETIFNISEEFLDKVTDAAQNGELRKGLDEYFGRTGHTNQVAGKEEEDGEGGERAEEEPKDLEDVADNDGSTSPSSSADGLSPFQFPSPSSSSSSSIVNKQKGKPPRVSTSSFQTREERKALRLYGKEYTTPSGKIYPQRQVRPKDCTRCRYNCSSSITPEQRQALFDHFWSLDSYVKRLYYYCQSIKEKPAKTMKHTRECSREYTFLVDGERVRVCKGFYLATLDVSDKAVRIAMEKRKRGKGMWDKRGGHPAANKSRPEEKDRVRSHIESVLIMDIYSKTAEDSPTAVPGQDLNVREMHQEYVQSCQEDGKEPVSEEVYRETFATEYNLTSVQV